MARFDNFKDLAKSQADSAKKMLSAIEARYLSDAEAKLAGFECPEQCGVPITCSLVPDGAHTRRLVVSGCCASGRALAEKTIGQG